MSGLCSNCRGKKGLGHARDTSAHNNILLHTATMLPGGVGLRALEI